MAPRRPTYIAPQPAKLSDEDMQRGIVRLQKRVAEIEQFDPAAVPERFHSSVGVLQTTLAQTLDAVFGHDTIERQRYGSAAILDSGPIQMGGAWTEPDFREYLKEGKENSLALLKQAITWLEEEIEERGHVSQPAVAIQADKPSQIEEVFIVHGRSAGPKEAVARLLEKLGLRAIILHEQPNEGRTVVEKVEAFGNVGFAIVLLTPDDVGSLIGEDLRPRARQNVVLELGYFLGKLGRKRVCTLAVGELELPSDWRGVIDEPFDEPGRWKFTLARELRAAGYKVDMNQVD